jgi:hypothetical protein
MTETTTTMTINLNGKETSIPAESTITTFLKSRALTG